MSKKNFVKEKLYAGQSVLGIWSIINSSITTDIAVHAGLDFQILDLEHGVCELTTLENCIRTCESLGCSPLVRVPAESRAVIQNTLDLGAHGIIVPQVQGHDDVVHIVNAMKFPPIGTRGFNPFTRAGCYNPKLPLESTCLHDNFGLTAVIIENQTAYKNIDQILTIQNLDLVYLGIYDFSFDIGLSGNVQHPDVLNFTASAIEKIKRAGKFSGVMVKDDAEMQKYLELGVNFIVYGVDAYIYYSAIESRVNAFQQQTKRKGH